MSKEKVNYLEEFRRLYSAEYIKLKLGKEIKTIKNVAVYWDTEKMYILDENDIMTFFNIDTFIELKFTKKTSKNLCSMIVVSTVSNYSELFSKRKYTNLEVG